MKIDFLKNFKDGWLVGNFSPSVLKTEQFELAIKKIKKGFVDKSHCHKKGEEFNVLISGKLRNKNQIITQDQLFIFDADEVSSIEALEDSTILVFRSYSDPNDKYLAEANWHLD